MPKLLIITLFVINEKNIILLIDKYRFFIHSSLKRKKRNKKKHEKYD